MFHSLTPGTLNHDSLDLGSLMWEPEVGQFKEGQEIPFSKMSGLMQVGEEKLFQFWWQDKSPFGVTILPCVPGPALWWW